MINEELDDIDYGNMDDLPLSDHIEWRHAILADAVEDYVYEMEWLTV